MSLEHLPDRPYGATASRWIPESAEELDRRYADLHGLTLEQYRERQAEESIFLAEEAARAWSHHGDPEREREARQLAVQRRLALARWRRSRDLAATNPARPLGGRRAPRARAQHAARRGTTRGPDGEGDPDDDWAALDDEVDASWDRPRRRTRDNSRRSAREILADAEGKRRRAQRLERHGHRSAAEEAHAEAEELRRLSALVLRESRR